MLNLITALSTFQYVERAARNSVSISPA